MGRVGNFIIKNKKRYIKGSIALLCINLLQITIPKITGILIDGISNSSIMKGGVIFYSSFVTIIAGLIFILNYLTRLQIMGASIAFQYEIRNGFFKHLKGLAISFFNKNSIGDIMALAVNDITAVRMAIGRGVNLILDTLFLAILSLIVVSNTVNSKLALVAFIPFPILVFAVVVFGKIISVKFKRVQESFGKITRKVQENISGIRVVKAFVQENQEIKNFKKLNENNYKVNMELVKVWGVFYPLIELMSSISYLLVLFYGSKLVLEKQITLGDFIAVNSYIGILVRPIKLIGTIINLIQKGRASMERINKIFYEKSKNEEKNKVNKKINGEIEFKNLTFSYHNDSRTVLKNINLTLKKGKITAVIGKIGSGKSTLANLILKFYDPNEYGQLYIDGIDIKDIPAHILRDNIGYVPQDDFLFSSTIKENIAFSPYTIEMKEIEQVAKLSEIYDDINNMEYKFDTVLGERGMNISGGQKQRISISRAIIRKPSILILDDCFSSVDVNTEDKILRNLKSILKKSTCLIIAHRISTIKYADEIIVMDDGSIVERGTHEELLKLKGIYFNMYKRQILNPKIDKLF